MSLKICVAQLNLVVGDLPGNARQIIDAAHTAHAQGARLLLTPELAISGYIAEDLFLRPAFIAACDDALNRVARETAGLGGLTIVVGHPSAVAPVDDVGPRCANAASVLCEGRRVAHYAKRLLPNYEVFDERRYFTPGQGSCVFTVDGVRVGLLICEDAWFDEPAAAARQAGAELLAVINASPYHQGKGAEREAAMARRARASGLPLVYANLVGGQDEVVFDGRSLAIGADGQLAGRAASFKENLFFVQASRAAAAIELKADMAPEPTPEAELWEALVLGLRDYVDKNG
ncbi:MAG TPA: nitrilase-related carbon-nitrogen hydrolase, partial [Ottowia sp.]|nr:nitrilase-related carbon-nitrogen hydrolase [Ottowia sp.]